MLRHSEVEHRPWLSSLAETAARRGAGVRSRAVYEGVRALAAEAARAALDRGGWKPESVDALVTTHTTSWTVPGLDVDLVRLLGLRPDVSRVGLATVACAGGAQALIQAARVVRANPGSRVLVVGAEGLSTLYHGGDQAPTLQSVLYGGLFGDAAAAVLVASDFTGGAAVEVEGEYELLLPDSADAYWSVVEDDGVRFDSGPVARRAAGLAVPYVSQWLEATGGGVSWAAVHPGGPGIIDATLEGVGLAWDAGRHSRASLAGGNLGGVALLDVLSRTFREDRPVGPGVLVAYGPGFTVAGLRVRAVTEGRPGAAAR